MFMQLPIPPQAHLPRPPPISLGYILYPNGYRPQGQALARCGRETHTHTAQGWHWSPGFVYVMHAVKNPTGPDTLLGAWGFCTYQMTTALVWQTQACDALQVSR